MFSGLKQKFIGGGIVLLLLVGGYFWHGSAVNKHDAEVIATRDAEWTKQINEAPSRVDTVFVKVEVPVIHTVTKAKTDTVWLNEKPEEVRSAITNFSKSQNGLAISGKAYQTYSPTRDEFGLDLFFNPIVVPKITETKTVVAPAPLCPEPFFTLTADVAIVGLMHDKIFDLSNKAYLFTLTPSFSVGRFTLSVPSGIAMIPRGDNSYKSALGFGLQGSMSLVK